MLVQFTTTDVTVVQFRSNYFTQPTIDNNKNTEQQTNLKHTYLTTNMTYLEFEQKQKEINMATELEKTQLAKEQLEYARSMADTLYNAFKSGNIAEGIFGQLGNIGGTIGGGKLGESLFGGIGSALGVAGGAVGGFVNVSVCFTSGNCSSGLLTSTTGDSTGS